MKIGLVSFLNARPLDFGLRQSGEHTCIADTPAALSRLLLAGELDAALISSVECLRHPELGYSLATGVCARGEVDSILYFQTAAKSLRAPQSVFADSGSRSSVALLQILLHKSFGQMSQIETCEPQLIPERCLKQPDCGGLLIGDNALRFGESQDSRNFQIRDLGAWWQKEEKLPFVFALWAYPRERPVPDAFFLDSLNQGLEHLPRIAAESGYRHALPYLKEKLHYILDEKDRLALRTFESYLHSLNLQVAPEDFSHSN